MTYREDHERLHTLLGQGMKDKEADQLLALLTPVLQDPGWAFPVIQQMKALAGRNPDEDRHQLVDGILVREDDEIIARCTCGWASGGHFTTLAASAAFKEHRDAARS